MKEVNIMPVMRKWKLQRWSGSKNSQLGFSRLGYMLSFECEILQLGEMVTMLRRKNVIHRGLASFWCMMHVLLSILVLKKNSTFWLTHVYIYIYIYIGSNFKHKLTIASIYTYETISHSTMGVKRGKGKNNNPENIYVYMDTHTQYKLATVVENN